LSAAADDEETDEDEETEDEKDGEKEEDSREKAISEDVTSQEGHEEEEGEGLKPQSKLKLAMLENVEKLVLGVSVVETEFIKLIHSSCINLLSDEYKDLYQKVIPRNTFKQILNICAINQKQCQDNCQEEVKVLVNQVFDDLKQFRFE
jgi:hypothetical protein